VLHSLAVRPRLCKYPGILGAAVFLGVTLRAPQYAGGALTMIAVVLLASADPRAP
jgi:hypothetical protein